MGYGRAADSTISGYLYQFDKSIIEIMNLADDDSVVVEGIEDIDIENENELSKSIQVKYYEESEYSNSKISEAIRYLFFNFVDYLNGKSEKRKYYIYGHYQSGTDALNVNEEYIIQETRGIKPIDIVKNSFLTYKPKEEPVHKYYEDEVIEYENENGDIEKRAITDEELEEFISLLKVNINAKSIDEQYEELLKLLEEKIDNCSCRNDAEEFYYNNALKVVFKLSQEKHENVKSLRDQIIELNNSKKSIQGKIKYREQKLTKKEDETTRGELEKFKGELSDIEKQIEDKYIDIDELNREKRTIKKSDFIDRIDKKYFLFNKWYAAKLGRVKYAEYVKDILYRRKSLNGSKNKYLIIGKEFNKDLINEKDNSIVEFIKLVIEDSFEVGKAFAKKSHPWTLVLDVDKKELKNITDILNKNHLKYHSGREECIFSIEEFNEEPIVNTDEIGILIKTSYQIKILSLSTFEKNILKIKDIDVAIFFMNSLCEDCLKKLKNRGISSYVVDGIEGNSLDDIKFLFEKRRNFNDYFRILSVSPNMLQVEVTKAQKFKDLNENFTIGSYIKITDENDNSVIGILRSYKIKDINDKQEINLYIRKEPSFILDIQPIGHISNGQFKKGNKSITIPPNEVEIANNELLKKIFDLDNIDKAFSIGCLPENITSQDEKIKVVIDGDKFFNKHLAVVGSTGSGKSCTVAKILQEGIKPYTQNQKGGVLNNSHIVLFDLHGEYQNAFKEECRYLTVDNIKLPYWLMNSEELQDYFLDVEGSDHNQRNIFKKAVTLNKKFNNPIKINGSDEINENITYDSPVYFSIKEVLCCINNYNNARECGGIYTWIYTDEQGKETEVKDIMPINFKELEEYSLLFKDTLKAKVGTGTKQANLNFTNFINRLENKIYDDRLSFLLKKGQEYKENLSDIIRQFIGYNNNFNSEDKNITIIDLSGVPFEVVNVLVALVSRLIFNFAFARKKILDGKENSEVPFLIVYEEAHNYIPKNQEIKYKSVREVVERIAKEGRKYGVSAMIVSQRPSEISETIFSQCNSFVVMRLTNPIDQSYIRKLLPEDINSITDSLASFDKREALILGDSVKMPALIKVDELESDKLPKSNDIKFIQEWRQDWNEMSEFDTIIKLINGSIDESVIIENQAAATIREE
ncbi:ATP-binding protein [Clostridium butyricum]|uniref:ATP-binding protein n=1 Tax=Clostridium butyricum TaxID=1492 RepID=UPI00189CFD30|nr:DUF87 domain-containing protein [Clostridium butyricum]MDB2153823.1 DUF87 domain-containing protein [Clostridium butyricum]